jgi:hypothetical protein
MDNIDSLSPYMFSNVHLVISKDIPGSVKLVFYNGITEQQMRLSSELVGEYGHDGLLQCIIIQDYRSVLGCRFKHDPTSWKPLCALSVTYHGKHDHLVVSFVGLEGLEATRSDPISQTLRASYNQDGDLVALAFQRASQNIRC